MSGLLESRWAPAPGADSSSSSSSSSGNHRPKPKPQPTPRSSRAPAPTPPFQANGNDQGRSQGGQGIVFTSASTKTGPSSANTTTTAITSTFTSTSTSTSPSRPGPPGISAQELSRFTKLVARLRWKLPFLEEGYRLATQEPGQEADPAIDTDVDATYAETMFKIDFHEYYALLERAIVHLLSVFGVTVSSTPSRKWRGRQVGQGVAWNGTTAGGPDGGVRGPGAGHSYHANVLETLEDPACPLHEVLGCGSVYEQLRKAKELRNRWKRADMSAEEEEREGWGRRPVLPLESYDFDQILTEIFGGLEDGYLLAQTHVEKVDGDGAGGRDVEMMDGGWDFIVEAMDWQAV